jgi:BNR repeat-like domain
VKHYFRRTGWVFVVIMLSLFFNYSRAQTSSLRKNEKGVHIVWDSFTLKKVSSPGARYCGYARLTQLFDQSLLAVYEADGTTVCVKSKDLGTTWSAPVIIAPKANGVSMSVPDILELKDHSILVCYNPRPGRGATGKKFGIRTLKSYDGGATWRDERLLYEADYAFQNGCWEPSAIQLPSGEIQLFFSNEGDYLTSNEQNISLVRSRDNGLTWSKTREIVSFRPGSRDGMPSPILLQNGKEIVFAIEDNGFTNFKPYTIRSTVKNNWSGTVGASGPDRNYAFAEPIADSIYAGAPYLRQLKTGQTILSYQGTEGRINKMNNADMKVVIGDSHAKNFRNKSVPFMIAKNKSALWNSLAVLSDNTIVALTSTSSCSYGNTEIWMIKGHLAK